MHTFDAFDKNDIESLLGVIHKLRRQGRGGGFAKCIQGREVVFAGLQKWLLF